MDEQTWRGRLDAGGAVELRRPAGSWTALAVVVGIAAVSVAALFSDEAVNRWSGWVGVVVFGVVGVPVALHGSRAGYPRTVVDRDGVAVSVRLHPLDRDHGWRLAWSDVRHVRAQSDRADAVVVAVDGDGTPLVLPTYPDVDARAWASWLEDERRRRA